MGIPLLKHLKNEDLIKQKDLHLEDCRNSTQFFIFQKDIQIQDLRGSHESLIAQKDIHIADLQRCIAIQAIIAAVIVIALVVVTCYLLGVRDEEKRRLEAQNFKYDEMIRTRISQLEKELENEKGQQQQQQLQLQQHQLQGHQTTLVAPHPQGMVYTLPTMSSIPAAVKV